VLRGDPISGPLSSVAVAIVVAIAAAGAISDVWVCWMAKYVALQGSACVVGPPGQMSTC
jgi:hypothetical protein